VEQRHPNGSESPSFTWGKLHPSPPNSQPSPVEPSLVPPIHSTENGQETRIAVINPATFCHLNVTSEGYFKTKKRVDLDRWGVIKRREGKNLTRPDLTVQKRKREEVEL